MGYRSIGEGAFCSSKKSHRLILVMGTTKDEHPLSSITFVLSGCNEEYRLGYRCTPPGNWEPTNKVISVRGDNVDG